MVKCMNDDCVNNFCCVECHRCANVAAGCCCETTQELEFDRERILKECQYAYEE